MELEGYNSHLSQAGLLSTPWFSGYGYGLYNVNLPTLAGEPTVRFRFRLASDGYVATEGPFLFSFNVMEGPARELALQEISTGQNACTLFEDVSSLGISLLNKGYESGYNIAIGYDIESSSGSSSFSETVPMDAAGYGDLLSYTFSEAADFTAEGTYQLTAWVLLTHGSGEEVRLEKTIPVRNLAPVSSLPYHQDFETDAPAGWAGEQAEGSYGWVWGNATSLSSTYWTIPEHSNFMASNDDKEDLDSSRDYLISPTFDLSAYEGDLLLEFDAYFTAEYSSTASVQYSLDGGITNETLFVLEGSTEWQRLSLNISDLAGSSCIQFSFLHNDNGAWASGFAIDNVSLTDELFTDLALQAHQPSLTASCLGEEEIAVKVVNPGISTIKTFSLTYELRFNNGTEIISTATEQVEMLLEAGSEMDYTFSTTADLSALGEYSITVRAALEGDEEAANNEIAYVITHASAIDVYPYNQGFDNAAELDTQTEGWNSSPEAAANWEARKAMPFQGIFPTEDHSGGGNFMFSYLYYSLNTSILESPCFNLSAVNKPVLSFYYTLYTNVNGELSVHILDTDKDEWHLNVWQSGIGERYDTEWNKASISLTGLGDNIRVYFVHEKAAGYSIATVDDVTISDQDLFQASLSLSAPFTGCSEGAISVEVENTGNQDIAASTLTVAYQLDGGTSVEEVIQEAIPAGTTLSYSFATQPQFTLGREYEVAVALFNADLTIDAYASTHYTALAEAISVFDEKTVYAFTGDVLTVNPTLNFRDLVPAASLQVEWSDGYEGNWREITAAGAYTATVSLGSSCSYTETLTVLMDDRSASLAAGAYCEVASLTPGSFVSYLWQDGFTAATYEATASGTYFVTVKDTYGRAQTVSAEVEINALPEVPALTATGSTTFCQGSEVILTAPAGFQYRWSGGEATRAITVKESGSYTVTVINENGCEATSEATAVTVNALPEAVITEQDGLLSATEGTSYQWYLNGALIQEANAQTYAATESGKYTVEVTNESGCSLLSAALDFIYLGLEDLGIQDFSIYPNPSAGKFMLDLNAIKGEKAQLQIVDLKGKLLFEQAQQQAAEKVLIEAPLPAGMYFLLIKTERGQSRHKLIIR